MATGKPDAVHCALCGASVPWDPNTDSFHHDCPKTLPEPGPIQPAPTERFALSLGSPRQILYMLFCAVHEGRVTPEDALKCLNFPKENDNGQKRSF